MADVLHFKLMIEVPTRPFATPMNLGAQRAIDGMVGSVFTLT